MARTIQDHGNEVWTVNKKRRQEQRGYGGRIYVPKVRIILGGFRKEVEVLADLHLRYPLVQLTRRINGAGNTILISKVDRSRILLAEVKAINEKERIHPPQAEEDNGFSKTGLSKVHPNSFKDLREDDGLVLNNDPYQCDSPSTSGRSTTINGTHRAATHIKLVHWNAQGAITKTSAIKTAIVQDDLDIVMIQDTNAGWLIS